MRKSRFLEVLKGVPLETGKWDFFAVKGGAFNLFYTE